MSKMSFLKKPFRKLKDAKNSSSNTSTSVLDSEPSKTEGIDSAISNISASSKGKSRPANGTSLAQALSGTLLAKVSGKDSNGTTPPDDSRYQSRELLDQERVQKSMDAARKKAENKKRESMARIEDERFLREGPAELTKLYKPFSMNMSKRWDHEARARFAKIDFSEADGRKIWFCARIHTLRQMSAKLVFIVFRQQTVTVQGVLQSFKETEKLEAGEDNTGTISEQMVRSIEHYPSETIVLVHARIRKAPNRVKNATIHDHEFEVYEVHKVGDLSENVPFTVYDAENINRDREDDDDDDDEGENSFSSMSEDGSPAGTPLTSIDPSRMSVNGMLKSNGISRSMSVDRARKKQDLSLDSRPGKSQVVSQSMSVRVRKSQAASRSSMDMYKQNRSLPQRVRLNNRIVDLRTGPAQSVFRIQSGICNLFRSYLDAQGFIEIHTPKLQGGATESGATVFEVNYFGRPAFLAQSPQLAKQMAIAADFERVYEIGAVFRAEDSNTPRHLTEYTGLDLEMALEEHYHEALDVIDGMFKNLWQGIYDRYTPEIEIISHFYPHEKVTWLEKTPRIPFSEGVAMLKEDGWVNEDGSQPSELEDLATRAEIRLGQLVKKKYHTDYYILDKFPASARPFYTMPDPNDDRITNSFDIFMRGQEILSGGQRIHDAKFLEKRMKEKGIRPETMSEYLEGFKWGAPPHAGCGIGLERLTYLFLNLGNIRLASLFHRDPKSLPAKPPTLVLRHEEASTTNPPWEQNPAYPNTGLDLEAMSIDHKATGMNTPNLPERKQQLQPLEKLIANYGDAANTSWLDARYHVYRHPSTGAAQGFVIHNNYAIAVGTPLCHRSQYPQVVSAFLQFLKIDHRGLKPLWMIIGPEVEELLGEKFGWRTLACIAEERADVRSNPALKDKDLARKVRHAESEGIKEIDLPINEPVPDELRRRIDERILDWQRNRKGTQVHLTQIRPWIDQEHRRYFYSVGKGKDGEEEVIHALCVLHQLSPQNGYQIKFSLEFPNAPSGTIESLILHSIRSIAALDPETKIITFGTGAIPTLEGGRNIGRAKVRVLKRVYEGIVKQFGLLRKSEFREKMGVRYEGVFVAYPRGGLGPRGVQAVMGFLKEEG